MDKSDCRGSEQVINGLLTYKIANIKYVAFLKQLLLFGPIYDLPRFSWPHLFPGLLTGWTKTAPSPMPLPHFQTSAADPASPGEANFSMSSIVPCTVEAATATGSRHDPRRSQRLQFPLPHISGFRVSSWET